MPTLLAFLRGINVGGNCIVPMADLKTLLASLHLENPRTLLQSGNVLFDLPAAPPAIPALAAHLENQIAARFGFPVGVLLRTANNFRNILSHNPFPDFAAADPSHLVIMFFKQPPNAQHVRRLQSLIPGREQLSAHSAELYLTYPDSIGASKLTSTLIEKTLKTRGTARNWNTLQKLNALLPLSKKEPESS